MKDALLALVRPFGQEHLLTFWDSLDAGQRESLAEEIRAIDYALIDRLCRQELDEEAVLSLAKRAVPPPAFRLRAADNRFTPQEACRRGVETLRGGQVAVILVAGGQGTRLGFDHPKGMFPIGPVSGNSLFQIHVEKILACGRRYGARIPLYVMTSPATHRETIEFLARHHCFALPEQDLRVFCQGTMPAVDAQSGKILLAAPGQVALSPDGHGGMLAALVRSGALADLRRRGIRQIFYFQVDNPLAEVCSPEFLGYHVLCGSEFSSQAVAKQTPLDKVGNIVEVEGRLRVIEYTEFNKLPEELTHRRAPDGSLWIWAGSIAIHAMDAAFLERAADQADALPFHVARKKVPHVAADARKVEPDCPNAIKFERFIFDLMPWAANAVVMEVDAARRFAPLKNASGDDSAESVKAQMAALHREWLRHAGAEVAEGVPVEISPLFALDPEELAAKIRPGTKVHRPTCFR